MSLETPRIVDRNLHRIMHSALSLAERLRRPPAVTGPRDRASPSMPRNLVRSTVLVAGQRSRPPVSPCEPELVESRDQRTRAHVDASAQITRLIYELLDAHSDTAQLAAGLADEPVWEAHLDYLRALQRKGREALAGIAVREPA
jgi:hypothetical protein